MINVSDYTQKKKGEKKDFSKTSSRDIFDHYSFKIIFSFYMKLTK